MERKKKTSERIVQVEIERKFLIPEIPPEITLGVLNGQFELEHIEQGYLPNGGARIRKATDREGKAIYTKTRKKDISKDGVVREEIIEPITKKEFESIWPDTSGARIKKKRYILEAEGYNIHLDMFEGELLGRVIGEIEFATEGEARSFVKPDWFGEDITHITNRRLAERKQTLPRS